MTGAATVIGFGSRTPSVILAILTEALESKLISKITSKRSSSFELALLKPPHRTWLSNEDSTDDDASRKNIIIYCLADGLSEHLCFGAEESNDVRRALLKVLNGEESNDTLVIIYDPKSDTILGSSEGDVLTALKSKDNNEGLALKMASAGLKSLSDLDKLISEHVITSVEEEEKKEAGDVVIVIGSGGREHALAVSIAKSPLVSRVICCPGNGGTCTEGSKISNTSGVKVENDEIVKLVKEVSADTVVIGPEAPLVNGLTNALNSECPDVKVFGPTKEASILEASKAFTKDFLQKLSIPTAAYQTFTSVSSALSYIESLDLPTDRQVIKASGLAAGKGVLLPQTKSEHLQAVKSIMSDKAFGSAGDTCVIESFLEGPEASCFALCDGKTAVLMPSSQDHKRALDGDGGLNTGGMGAYAPAPCVTADLHEEIEGICKKVVEKMAEDGMPYVGLLYAGMILTPDGPYVLEFNCRFGDPETQVVLPLLETDLYQVIVACCNGTLSDIDVRFKENQSAVTVVCAAKGYPEKYPKGMETTGLEDVVGEKGVKVYHAGTKVDAEGKTRCSGGRVLAVTGMGSTLEGALQKSYGAVSKLDFINEEGGESFMHNRTDIAKRAIHKKLRIGVMGSTRGTALIPVMEACASGEINAEIVCVLSNKKSALILEKGKSLGVTVKTCFVSSKGLSRDEYDAECTSLLLGAGVEYILLVGYMRILSTSFCQFWDGKCINVHPSLLPKHAGLMDLAVHQSVIDSGDTESGCTIHEVTATVDDGPIVVQKKVKVEAGETAESLKSKVQPMEGPAFVEAIQKYICSITKKSISYADAGVSVDTGNSFVTQIKPFCRSTKRPGCDSDLGGFGGLFDLKAAGYHDSETVLIGATDGVGTKLMIAQETGKHEGVGVDLVAMCVNDLIVAGGEPLFFLDYYATGKLHVEDAALVVKGIAQGCKDAECGLIGGETAEMPSMYGPGDYDLAGFSVGAVKRDKVLPQNVAAGDVLLGLSSSGIHSNGFSLVRKLLEKEGISYGDPCPWDSPEPSVADSLLTPTKIYVKSCLPLIKKGLLNGLAHITGGGLLENLPRSMPKGTVAEITAHPPLSSLYRWLKQVSAQDDNEMLRTFNCGIGMVLIIKQESVSEAKDLLREAGETDVFDLGQVVEGKGGDEPVVVMKTTLV